MPVLGISISQYVVKVPAHETDFRE